MIAVGVDTHKDSHFAVALDRSRSVESFAAEITRMEDSGAEETVVDLSQLEFIDPSGMEALADAERRFRADGRRLHLRGEPRRFARHGDRRAPAG